MRWCLQEGTDGAAYADQVLDRLLAGDEAHVPVLWLYEVVSVLARYEQKGMITPEKAHGFLEDLRSLEVAIDLEGIERILDDVHRLALEHNLTGYDASYLELALRKQLPLASLDSDLNKAAVAVGLPLVKA
jgi:predicted nucleic acid-binding protein